MTTEPSAEAREAARELHENWAGHDGSFTRFWNENVAIAFDRFAADQVREHQSAAIAGICDAARICSLAAHLVGGDRQVLHGDKSINFANTAGLWNAILSAKMRQLNLPICEDLLEALDVANMLEAFKIARRYAGTHNLDDYVDGAGYAGCAGEIADKENAK